MKVQNSVVVVTGASAGIGAATVECLAQAGANVVITARRAERLAQLVDRLAVYPGRRLAVPGDIRDESFAHTLLAQTVAEFGHADVLINNAGLGHRSSLADVPAEHMRTILDTNVLGLMYATQAAVPYMKSQGRGQIINISSLAGQRPLPYRGMYCASKTAVNFLSRGLRMELRPYHIIVTLVYPGLTATEFADARLGEPAGAPFGLRGIPPERVARAIVKAIRYGHTEVYVTLYDWLLAHINRLFPRTIDWLLSRVIKFT